MNGRVSFTTLKGPVPEPSPRTGFGKFFGLDPEKIQRAVLARHAEKTRETGMPPFTKAVENAGESGEAKTKVRVIGFKVWIKTKYTGISSRFYKTMKRIKKKLDNEWLIAKGVEKIKAAREIALKPIAMIREWAHMFNKKMGEIFPPSHAHPDSQGRHGPHHHSHGQKPPGNQPPRIEAPEMA